MKAWSVKILEIVLVVGFMSCEHADDNNICPTEQSEERLKEFFDVEEFYNDFQILFYSQGGWGGFQHKIEILKKDSRFKSNAELINRRAYITGTTIIDTLEKNIWIDKLQIDSLLLLIENLNCQPYDLDQYSSCSDCDYHKIFIKYKDKTRAWMWHGETMSKNSSGRFLDSIKIKALWIEGFIYKLSGFNQSKLAYYFDGECQSDSIDFYIIPSPESFIVKSIDVSHPKYPVNEFYTEYSTADYNEYYPEFYGSRIACQDTSTFIEGAKITVLTKDDEIRVVTKINRYKYH